MGRPATGESRHAAEMQKAKQFAFRDQKTILGALNRILFTPGNISVGPSLGGVLNKIFNQNRVARHGSRSWFNIRGHENPFFHRPVVNIFVGPS